MTQVCTSTRRTSIDFLSCQLHFIEILLYSLSTLFFPESYSMLHCISILQQVQLSFSALETL